MTIGCVVMAAGLSRRFGADKLAAVWEGKALLQRALEAVPAEELAAVAVVVRTEWAEALARRFGFLPVRNDRPDLGLSRTIRLGLEALPPCDAVLFQTADQPLLRRETVGRLVRLCREQPQRIAALSHRGVRGSPCLFPARFFPELLALEGDQGGSAVIRRHREDLLLCEAAEEEPRDVDVPF